ncbi:MAG: hypothetical protein AB3N13_09130 [Arenibacterium sp.]
MFNDPLSIEALDVTSNPEKFCDTPEQFTWSWAVLKAERGQVVKINCLPAPSHRIVHKNNLTDRIRRHIKAMGLPARPPALIAPGALA